MQSPDSKKWTTDVFGLDTSPVPVSGCTSPAYFEQEVEKIFRRCWINVGRVHEVEKPGDYFVFNFDALKSSIIVVHDAEGAVRAFHNVCSHRCNKVTWESRGSCRRFACEFHGWTYSLDGRLQYVPDEAEFFNFSKAENGLTPVAVEIWEGFIFINVDPNPSQTLKEFMGDIYDGIEGYPFDKFTNCYAWQMEIGCNWKILRDAFSELYHVPFIHKVSAADNFQAATQAVPHALGFNLFPHGGLYSIFGTPAGAPCPVGDLANKYGSTTRKTGERLEKSPKIMNPQKSDDWAGDLLQLFPNFMIALFPGFYLWHGFRPVSPDRCTYVFRAYYTQPTNAAQRFSQEYAATQLRDSILEDSQTLEQTQSVLSSGGKTHFHLSDQELLIRFNHKLTQDFAGPYPAA